MTTVLKTVRTALLTGCIIAVLIACSSLLGASAQPTGSTVAQTVIEPVQRVIVPAAGPDVLPDLVEAACPAIVSITIPPDKRGKAVQTGGVVISAGGLIIASSHGMQQGAKVEVAFSDSQLLVGQVMVLDELSALAIVQVEGKGLKALSLYDSDLPRVGSWGFTLSSPAGRGCAVRSGEIMQDFTSGADVHRSFVQIHPAQEAIGLPFIGRDGRLLAFSTGADGQTVNFLPANILSRVASQMTRSGEAPVAPFGLMVAKPGPAFATRLQAGRQRGAVVVLVKPLSAAANAGLFAGDIVLTAGDNPIAGPAELERALNAASNTIELQIQRRGNPITVRLQQ